MSEEKKSKEHPLQGLEDLGNVPPTRPDETETQGIPDVLPVLPMFEMGLFPKMVFPLVIFDKRMMAVVQDSFQKGRIVGLFTLRDETHDREKFTKDDFYEMGVAAYVLKMSRGDDGNMRLLVQGLSRIKVLELVSSDPYPMARVEALEETFELNQETQALMGSVKEAFRKFLKLSPSMPEELAVMNQNIDHPGLLADMVTSGLNIKRDERQDVLNTLDVRLRLEKVLLLLQGQLELLELGSKIQNDIKEKIDKGQRDFYLREQMKAIQNELGEKDEDSALLDELIQRLNEKKLPREARDTVQREVNRLKRMSPASAEYTVSRTYLDWILDLPWQQYTDDNIDINEAQRILDADHFDLEKVKKRIVEYLAVRKLKPDMKGPILCFVGPPGTGKTSLGRSIARAMGRKFIRMSLGGVRDEAEIRGHRRTYIGALPGRILQGLKKAGTSNPVFMLDEVDKLGGDYRGDPSSALLEVLDPEQNFSFSDHYLEVEYDLSRVLFIATANVLDTIPGPLRDRMEVLHLSGYTTEEKLHIAKRYLVPRQRSEHGLTGKQILFRDGALKAVISDYTREAGVRNLEREIGSVCRHVAADVARGKDEKHIIKAETVVDILGAPRFESEVRARTAQAGVATGLAWTQAGGDILFIEATSMPGKGGLILTGQLGDVMKESAQAALSVIRSRSRKLAVEEDFFSKHDIHIHVPAGAIPKDGPSAGVTLTSALASLVTGRKVRSDLAMTGEITLRGLVLPVGGIKEKVLAAKRAGIKTVVLPKRNEKDFLEISEHLRKDLDAHFAQKIDEVFDLALQ